MHVRGPSLDLVNKWIEDCRTSHQKCAQHATTSRRKFRRILQIGNVQGADTIRLVETEDVPDDAEYMTLSHCWGMVDILKLSTTNFESMKQEVLLSGLPKTFSDAVDIVRSLKCRFLWIDSLCILQDSAEDWRSQAAVMGEIYEGGICNIAATAAKNGHDGLLMHVNRHPAYIESLHVCVPSMGQPTFEDIEEDEADDDGNYDSIFPKEDNAWTGMAPGYYDCYDTGFWSREVSQSPLLSRAWVVQERLLAPRVVHFGAHQIYWECNTQVACERYPSVLLEEGDIERGPKSNEITSGRPYPASWASSKEWNEVGPCPQILRTWDDIVEAYSLGQLTFESDKLVAIAGLQNMYATRIKAPYLAGLWGIHLPRQLLWSILKPTERPTVQRAPSWSWTSVNGQVVRSSFVDTDDLVVKRLITILELPERAGTEPEQKLRVQGRLIPCSLSFDSTAYYEAGRYSPLVRGLESAAVVVPDTTDLDSSAEGVLPDPFFCVPVAIICEANTPTVPEVAGLVLGPTGSRGTFHRFGAFRTDQEVGRDGDSHGDTHMHLTKAGSSQPGRVFLMDVEDELAEVEEQFYQSYEKIPEKKGFGNFVFTIV